MLEYFHHPPCVCYNTIYITTLLVANIVKIHRCVRSHVYVCDACRTANHHRKPSVLMVDELLSAYPHQLSFSEAGMRIMITSHFSPRTRLTMASRMLITEVWMVAAVTLV